jgi:polygalacturonase
MKRPVRTWVNAASILALAAGVIMVAPGTAAGAVTLNVRDFGAVGNGSTNDSGAIQRAINAANAAEGGGTVVFPPGTYQSRNTIQMRSNVTLQVNTGATIRGASNDEYDEAEDNPFDDFQDFGHSHFHNAMIRGDRLTNIGFVGGGVIDGGGHLITGNPDDGEADKIISLTRCNGLRVGDGLTLRRGGHFAMLINGCTNVVSDRLTIDTASDRDGWNIISTTNVTITNARILADDDALAFKSDYALGAKLPNGNVRVSDSHLEAICCNALMFGSETCGDFTGYNFERITINGSNKSGLGMVSMDGTVISDVHYKDITMTNVRGAIMQKIGTRRRCGNNPGIGRITNVTYDNIRSTGQSGNNFSATLWGEPGANNRISNVSFNNVHLTVPGGNSSTGTGVPSNNPNDYNPVSIGTRPAYGWYIRYANGVRFTNSSVQFNSGDSRAAVIANNSSSISFDGFQSERSNGSNDMVFQSTNGFCVQNSSNTAGGALRVSQTGSTQNCQPTTPPNRFEAESGTCEGTIDSNHVGFSGTGFCNFTNAVGTVAEIPVTRETAGNATLRFGFANGTTAARPMDIAVNGVGVGSISFPATGAWTTYQTQAITAALNAGTNTIRLTSTGAAGGPNLDYVDIQ